MDDSSPLSLALYGAVRCVGLGLLVGALEAFTLPIAVDLPLGPGGTALLAAVSIVAFGLVGGGVGLVIGVPVHVLMRRWVISRGLAAQAALTALVLVGVFFGGLALEESQGGRAWVVAGLLGFTVFLPAMVFLFASRLFRMVEHGQKAPVPFLAVAGGVAVLGLGVAAGLAASKDTGGSGALDSDPRFVVIAVDGLRADEGGAPTPALDRLAAEGSTFTEAVTPTPATAPALASLLTGRPPLRHRVVRDGDTLGRYRSLLANVFQDAGYATGGFVSTRAAGHDRGFGYGFHVYDDDLGGPLRGLTRLRLFAPLAGLLPADRPDAATVDAFLGWLDDHDDVPFFALVHLHGPRAPFVPHGLPGFGANGTPDAPLLDHAARLDETDFSETDRRVLVRLYQEEVAAVDAQIGRILEAIDAAGLADNTVVVVVGTGGHLLGEHGGAFRADGLYDETVRVAMLLRVPGEGAGAVVSAQVRVHDLYPSLLVHAEVEPPAEPEAVPLLDYLSGKRERPLWTPILGRSLEGRWTLGYRDNGLKYLRDLETGDERLYDLDADPDESDDVSGTLPDTLQAARGRLASEAVLAGDLLGLEVAPAE